MLKLLILAGVFFAGGCSETVDCRLNPGEILRCESLGLMTRCGNDPGSGCFPEVECHPECYGVSDGGATNVALPIQKCMPAP